MADDKKNKPDPESKDLVRKDVISPEVAEVMKAEQNAQVNINVLLVQVTNQAGTSQEKVEAAKEAFELAQKFETARLENFKARSDALIDVKNRDPDEVEKRANNRTRRHLKYGLAVTGLLGIGGGLAVALTGGAIVPCGLLLSFGGLTAAMMGPLASGESVSSNDVVRIVSSLRNLGSGPPTNHPEDAQKGKKR